MGIRGKPDQVFYYQGEGPGKTGGFFSVVVNVFRTRTEVFFAFVSLFQQEIVRCYACEDVFCCNNHSDKTRCLFWLLQCPDNPLPAAIHFSGCGINVLLPSYPSSFLSGSYSALFNIACTHADKSGCCIVFPDLSGTEHLTDARGLTMPFPAPSV